jgi:RimJ/RimL family protein N-acetyltransferase
MGVLLPPRRTARPAIDSGGRGFSGDLSGQVGASRERLAVPAAAPDNCGMSIVLRRISAAAGEALRAGRPPADVRVAADYPTEFSAGVGEQAASGAGPLGPFFIHRAEDDVVVGEIGGGVIAPGTVEIGYAIVRSCWGRGHATAAVQALVARARDVAGVERVIAHTPLDRPASGRVLEKAGFACVGEEDDQHDGAVLRVKRWELPVVGTARAGGVEIQPITDGGDRQ